MTLPAAALSAPRGVVLRDLRGADALRALMAGDDTARGRARTALAPLVDVLRLRWESADAGDRAGRPTLIDTDDAWADYRYAHALHDALAPAADAAPPARPDDDDSLDALAGLEGLAEIAGLDSLDSLDSLEDLAEIAEIAEAEPADLDAFAGRADQADYEWSSDCDWGDRMAAQVAVPGLAAPAAEVPAPVFHVPSVVLPAQSLAPAPAAEPVPAAAPVPVPEPRAEEPAPETAPVPRAPLRLRFSDPVPGFVPSGPDE